MMRPSPVTNPPMSVGPTSLTSSLTSSPSSPSSLSGPSLETQPAALVPLAAPEVTLSRAPAAIEWQALLCPACGDSLDEDRDGTSCRRCGGLLVQRVWAERCMPDLGRPVLPPVYLAELKELACPTCRKAMAPVLCHGVASWSCGRCRWLFFDGHHKQQLVEPTAVTPTLPTRSLAKPSLLHIVGERARNAAVKGMNAHFLDALGILVLTALIVAVVVVEMR